MMGFCDNYARKLSLKIDRILISLLPDGETVESVRGRLVIVTNPKKHYQEFFLDGKPIFKLYSPQHKMVKTNTGYEMVTTFDYQAASYH